LTAALKSGDTEPFALGTFFSAVSRRGIAGRFPAAFALRAGRSEDADEAEFPCAVCASAIGEIARILSGVRDDASDETVSRELGSAVTEFCELPRLGPITGRRLFALDATNRFVDCPLFFTGEGTVAVECFISSPLTVVLSDEVISGSFSSSSGESWGDRNRAVGRGPVADGPRDFFKIGCAGGGFEALDERLRRPLSFANSCL
jgi:hypothetical protein